MWPDLDRISVYLRPGKTDMRKQIDGLSALVARDGIGNPFGGSLYLFSGRDNTLIKALYWDRNGFCLWSKRIEQGSFPWPKATEGLQTPFVITREELSMLLDGIDFRRRFKSLDYSSIA